MGVRSDLMAVPTYAWVLPRPKADKYPGGFPLHFERKLVRLLDNPSRILHPFGGMGEFGLRVDIRRTHPYSDHENLIWEPPHVQADAHYLPFKDNLFDLVLLDPPYSTEDAARIYRTPPVVYKQYVAEAVRVCRMGGFVAAYHVTMLPRPVGTVYYCRILLGTRVWHRLRACCVFRKESPDVSAN